MSEVYVTRARNGVIILVSATLADALAAHSTTLP